MDIAQLIQTIALYALPVLFAITIAEAARGYVANYFGDKTAESLGRLSLNPAKHIDPFGTILIPLILFFATSGAFLFGSAKPIPIRFGNLRKPKTDFIWVELAGPLANLIMAFFWGFASYALQAAGITEPFLAKMCQAGFSVNVSLFAFLLFPLPPLPGGRILVGLLPRRQAELLSKIEPWGFFVVMALIIAGVLTSFWLRPVMTLAFGLLNILLSPLAMLIN